MITDFLTSDEAEVANMNADLFRRALELCQTHKDKARGLTDCTPFVVTRERGVADALTYDVDFRQAGFNPLMREP